MAPKARKHQHQVVARLHPQDFATIVAMSGMAGNPTRESLVRDLVSQGLVALRAAAHAEDVGEDRDAAATQAVRLGARLDEIDGAVTKHLLDLLGAHFDAVAARSPTSAMLQESGTITALTRDLGQREETHGTTVAQIMASGRARRLAEHRAEMAKLDGRLAAQEQLAERLVVREES